MNQTSSLRVAVVDDHEMIRIGFAGLTDYGIEVGARTATVDDLLVQEGSPAARSSVAVLDVQLDDGSWVADNVRRLRSAGYLVVIMTSGALPDVLREAVVAGASALVTKNDQLAPLAEAIRAVHGGSALFITPLTAHVVHNSGVHLTPVQRETLRHIVSGLSNPQIAALMNVGDDDVVACLGGIASAYRTAYPESVNG